MLTFIDLHTGKELMGEFSSVLCLGNFDGVHKGHVALISRTLEIKDALSKKRSGILGGAWCFRQPPADFLSPDRRTPCITSLDEKLELFAKLGVDIAILGDFPSFRDMSPNDFTEKILKEKCKCVAAVCGFNFTYGSRGMGKPDDLKASFGDACAVLDPVTIDGMTVSSTAIREYISRGDVETASLMLGRPYSVDLTVVEGKKLGRTLGIPTVNQFFPEGRLVPQNGVYASFTELDGKVYPSVSNVGLNPTVSDGRGVRCETHIIGFSGDLYGRRVKVSFCKYIRTEQKFANIDELRAAMERDSRTAEDFILSKYKI